MDFDNSIVVLRHWVYKKNRVGLTIPFLLGVPTIFDSSLKVTSNDIEEFVDYLISENDNIIFTYNFCDEIMQKVIGLSPYPFSGGLNIENNSGKIILSLGSSILSVKSITEFKDHLLNTFGEEVETNNFSWNFNTRQFTPYTKEEIEEIKYSLN